jgi:hypothetical protein
MVTALLSGGLGNQMFQYAAAKSLAARLDTSFAIDLYPFAKKTKATIRPYELDIFNIGCVPHVSSLKGKVATKARPFIQKHRDFFQQFGILTDTYAILYQPVFESISGNIILSGYFQNEKYFEKIAEALRTDFTFKKTLTDKNLAISGQLKATNSVAIHIRRGDYLKANSQSNFITLDKVYYKKAIEAILGRVENPAFFVFSEDFDWIKENLDFDNHPVTFIDWNKGRDSYIDMQLMSLCKHNIIANSSFSWWGAWLNNNRDKMVIAPERWFREEQKNKLLDDFYPKGWNKL